ncbi:MAG: bifunctional heptose 7-phosphate kinase/heptose 1-phosphate adenyltransferase [Sedimentisphaerales bacterium]|nr:bifunctional heptose 7-phosphate kinase/heptose 1-phosphate adenyltransferase [Sedimentisphaerales bacterium]
MYEQLLKTIGNLGAPRILVVGDFMLDAYVYGDAVRISPEAPVPVLKVTETQYRCGGAASVAADVAALGATPVCIGAIGQDAHGTMLRDSLAELGADLTGLQEVPGRPTITKQRLIGLAQHRHKQQLMRIDREPTEPLSLDLRQRIVQHYRERVREVDIVCLQDHDKGMLAPRLCQQMIGLAREMGTRVLVDPALGSAYAPYSGATVLTPNRREAAAAVGHAIESTAEAAEAACRLRRDLALDAVVITLDKEGAYLATADINDLVPVKPRNVYDVTGAGDAVLATLAVSLAADSDYLMAVHLANIAGGIAVEKFGTATVTVSEMVHEIAERFGATNTKLRSLNSLLDELKGRRERGQTIVFTNGCFDVIHRGHIEYLQFCKAQGDVVVVGLNSDGSVRGLKGEGRPINNQIDRATVLSGLESVDFVTIFEEPTPTSLLERIRPHILIKGSDWGSKKSVVGHELVESYGGKVMLAPLVKGKSSTATIEKMKALRSET